MKTVMLLFIYLFQIRFNLYIVNIHSCTAQFNCYIQYSTAVTSTHPILPKTMSKRSIELFNHLYDNYQDKIQCKGKKVVQIAGHSTNIGIDRLFKNLYSQHKVTFAEQMLLTFLFEIRASLPPTLLTKRLQAKIKKYKPKNLIN